jgi:hypothetical protein
MRPFHLLTLALSFWLASCAAAPGGAAPAAQTGASGAQRTVILIGIDGFRADYLQRGVTPNLSRLAREGATAQGGMQPSFPSITFPNFYTLATGMHPDRHGLVSNSMEDPALPGRTFKLSDRAEVMDRVWYEDGEPIWVTAERAGVRTGTLFWPGLRGADRRRAPTLLAARSSRACRPQGGSNMLLGWLTLPPAERPAVPDPVLRPGRHGRAPQRAGLAGAERGARRGGRAIGAA